MQALMACNILTFYQTLMIINAHSVIDIIEYLCYIIMISNCCHKLKKKLLHLLILVL